MLDQTQYYTQTKQDNDRHYNDVLECLRVDLFRGIDLIGEVGAVYKEEGRVESDDFEVGEP